MNFNHLLLSSEPRREALLEYGFRQEGNVYTLKTRLDDGFIVTVTYDSEDLTAEVHDQETDERYALLDVKSANGSFVCGLRAKVMELLGDIHEKCFSTADLKALYVNWLEENLGVRGDYPWENDSTSAVYRCSGGKWFALVMQIRFSNLGFESDEPVWAVNLKADPEKIPQIVDRRSVFPAWHMNKKYWITVVLTGVTCFEQLKELTLRSRELVEGRKN